MSIDLDAIQARADAATKGPWILQGEYPQQILANDDGLVLVAECFTSPSVEPRQAEFITHARTDVPTLVARVRELERDADHWQTLAKKLGDRAADVRQLARDLEEDVVTTQVAKRIHAALNGGAE